ncbi:MAG: hypothetical protein LBR15_08520 [Methanobrevibacter sp.]|jgi:antitoxin component of RelBE/YafQ-DinJ toxin-antitoxin module|nr:hypothetical protein [Candidatus Methanovirga australis]
MVEKLSLVHIYMDEELKIRFKSYCDSQGMSMGEVIRWYMWFRVMEVENSLPD